MNGPGTRVRLATVWLGGCSGCHMSFLDLDELLFDLVDRVQVVYSPLADVKDYPEGVDVALVEGAVANEENLDVARTVRARSSTIVSFGDCAVAGNVTAMRNPLGDPRDILRSVYVDAVDRDPGVPDRVVPALLPAVMPLHQVVPVEHFLPGCPPPPERIHRVLVALLDGDPLPDDRDIRFG